MSWSNHSPYEKTLEYRRNRPLVLVRDKHTCQIGGYRCTVMATQVDHITPKVEGGDDSMGNLRAVCDTCHKDKTHSESRRSYTRNRQKAKHSWTRVKHPGLRFQLLDWVRQVLGLEWPRSRRLACE